MTNNRIHLAGRFSLFLIAVLTIGCIGDPPGYQQNQENQEDNQTEETPVPVRIIEPISETVYTNDSVTFELEIDDGEGVYDVELVIGETEEFDEEAIASMEDSLLFTWSTLERTPGTYQIQVKYSVEEETYFLDDERTIIVDRRAPAIDSVSPEPGISETRPASPIEVTFDEPLLASSVSVETVQFVNGEEELSYTVALSADRQTITVEFDLTDIVVPLDATLSFDGVTDPAGNEVDEVLNWYVPAWLEESIDAEYLQAFRIVEIDGQEYLLGIHQTEEGVETTIQIFEAKDGAWEHILTSENFTTIHALDAAVHDGLIYVAYLTTQAPNRRARLLVFDPDDESLEASAVCHLASGQDIGRASLSLTMKDESGLIAIANHEKLYVHEFEDQDFCDAFEPTFDIDEYSYVRPETVRTNIRADDRKEVIFSHCTIPGVCSSTHTRHITKAATAEEWTISPGTFSMTSVNNDCDKFNGFDVVFSSEGPFSVMSYRNQCPGVPFARGGKGTGLGLSYIADVGVANLIPGNDTESVYRPSMVATGNTTSDVLFAAPKRLELLAASQGSLQWVNTVETGLPVGNTQTTQYHAADLFRTSQGTTVVFLFGAKVHIFRANQ